MKDKRLNPNDFDLTEITFLEHKSFELDDVDPSEIKFLAGLGGGEESEVFLVSVRAREYAMKVVRRTKRPFYDDLRKPMEENRNSSF